jgi:hypothetical protein
MVSDLFSETKRWRTKAMAEYQKAQRLGLGARDDRSGAGTLRQMLIVAVPPVRTLEVFGPAEVW